MKSFFFLFLKLISPLCVKFAFTGTSPVGVTLCSELGDVAAAVAPLHRQTASGCSETSEMSVNNGSKELISWSRIHRMLYKDSAFLVIKMDKSELKVVLESGIESRYFWVRSIGNHLVSKQLSFSSCKILKHTVSNVLHR